MKLSVLERIVLLNLLPRDPEDDYSTYKIITNLKMDLSFSEQEWKDFQIVEKVIEGETKMFWDDSLERPKDVEIGEKAWEIVSNGLKALDKQKKINGLNASLYERFVLTVK